MSRLSSGCPATIAGPDSPPESMAGRETRKARKQGDNRKRSANHAGTPCSTGRGSLGGGVSGQDVQASRQTLYGTMKGQCCQVFSLKGGTREHGTREITASLPLAA